MAPRARPRQRGAAVVRPVRGDGGGVGGAAVRWALSNRADPAARAVADRHYNRQHVGADQFVPPGKCLVLYAATETGVALWISHAPDPRFVKHRWPGAWVCTAFRNEGAWLSSELIREALAATVDAWGPPPAEGMLTFVDPTKTAPKEVPGWCFRRAGFKSDGFSEGGLVALVLPARRFPAPSPPLWRGVDARWDTRQQGLFR